MRVIGCVLAGLVAAAAAGCGEKVVGVSVTGHVVKNGAPYSMSEGEGVVINLASEDGKATGVGAVMADGTFGIQKSSGGPLPAGKYKVSYTHNQSSGASAKKAFTKTETKQVAEPWDVSPTNTSFTLDLGKK